MMTLHRSIRNNFVLFLLLVILSTFTCSSSAYQVTENFRSVIDKAAANVVTTAEWADFMQRKFSMVDPVPKCSSSSVQFPSVFNISRNYLVFCYDKGALEPWPSVYTKFSQMVVDVIVKQYPTVKLTANVTEVDINQLGYFPSLKNAVDSGSCDVAVASTHYSDARAASAHFQCSYGLSYSGILRTELDNTTYTVSSEKELNQAGLIIAVANTSTFDAFVTANCPKATIIRLDEYQDAWDMVLKKKIHILLGDGSDLLFWLSKNKENCYSCSVKLYGTPFSYGSFITSQIIGSGGVSTLPSLVVSVLVMIFIAFVMI